MAKMYFAKTVKYEKQTYPPNTIFDVKDEDVNELKMVGGWVVQESKKQQEVVKNDVAVHEEVSESTVDRIELVKIAKELGIKVKKSWDDEMIKAEIANAQSK